MAGSNWKQRCEAAEAKAQELETELTDLKARIAEHAPDLLERERKVFNEYTPDIIPVILALAEQGMGEAEWISHMGLTPERWAEWVRTFPDLRQAVDQARARGVAFWDRAARQAMRANNSRFPTHVYSKWREAQAADAQRINDVVEDASELVIFDLRASV